jgi:hypothetical protein
VRKPWYFELTSLTRLEVSAKCRDLEVALSGDSKPRDGVASAVLLMNTMADRARRNKGRPAHCATNEPFDPGPGLLGGESEGDHVEGPFDGGFALRLL